MTEYPAVRRREHDASAARVQQAMRRVRHPIYRHLVAELVDSLTLQIAAVEHAIGEDTLGGSHLRIRAEN
jgi:hypothetical protein